jgi:hypothetical protein
VLTDQPVQVSQVGRHALDQLAGERFDLPTRLLPLPDHRDRIRAGDVGLEQNVDRRNRTSIA